MVQGIGIIMILIFVVLMIIDGLINEIWSVKKEWTTYIADVAFTFGGVGAILFLFSLIYSIFMEVL